MHGYFNHSLFQIIHSDLHFSRNAMDFSWMINNMDRS